MAIDVKTVNSLAFASIKTRNGLAVADIKNMNGVDTTSGGGGGFVPTDIAGCELWLDASQIVGLSDGDPVATWPDESGNGNNAAQVNPGSRPTFQTNELNLLPVVRFGGVLNIPYTSSGPNTIFVVGATTGGSGYQCHVAVGGPNVYARFAGGNWGGIATGSELNSGETNLIPKILTAVWHNYDDVDLYTNGGSFVNVTAGIGYYTSAGIIGQDGSGSQLTGDIAEIIVYNSALGTTDRQTVEAYLATKYGL